MLCVGGGEEVRPSSSVVQCVAAVAAVVLVAELKGVHLRARAVSIPSNTGKHPKHYGCWRSSAVSSISSSTTWNGVLLLDRGLSGHQFGLS